MTNRGQFGLPPIIPKGPAGSILTSDPSLPSRSYWAARVPRTVYTKGQFYNGTRFQSRDAGGLSWSSDQVLYNLFYCEFTARFDQARVYLNATTNARLGVYRADRLTGQPSTLMYDLGVITGVGAGDKTLSGLDVMLKGGTYYWTAIVLETTVSIWTLTRECYPALSLSSPGDGLTYVNYYQPFAYGPLPGVTSNLFPYTANAHIQLRAA